MSHIDEKHRAAAVGIESDLIFSRPMGGFLHSFGADIPRASCNCIGI